MDHCQVKVLLCMLCLLADNTYGGRKNVLNLSNVAPVPDMFWPMRSGTHNSAGGSRYAILHNLGLSTGPTINSASLIQSVSFLGNNQAYMEINNQDGAVDGDSAMCWIFFIYFTDATQDAVLLEYNGQGKGVKLKLKQKRIVANIYDNSGSFYVFTSSFEVLPNQWQCIGINFNYLWSTQQFDVFLLQSNKNVVYSSLTIQSGNKLDAFGNVRFGLSHDDNEEFAGRISCIQFYRTSLIKSTQEDAYDVCDPNLWASGFTYDFTEDYNSANPTTTATVTSQSLNSVAGSGSGSAGSSVEYTVNDPKTTVAVVATTTTPKTTTKTIPTTTVAVVTTTTTQTTTTTTGGETTQTTFTDTTQSLATTEEPQTETFQTGCISYTNTANDTSFLTPLMTLTVGSFADCVTSCTKNNNCYGYSMTAIPPFLCVLGQDSHNFIISPGYQLYLVSY